MNVSVGRAEAEGQGDSPQNREPDAGTQSHDPEIIT